MTARKKKLKNSRKIGGWCEKMERRRATILYRSDANGHEAMHSLRSRADHVIFLKRALADHPSWVRPPGQNLSGWCGARCCRRRMRCRAFDALVCKWSKLGSRDHQFRAILEGVHVLFNFVRISKVIAWEPKFNMILMVSVSLLTYQARTYP
jgi:hypothetical protein